ncbi:MAG: hypothetical protein KDA42_02940 [Planctomycetales bacterium]|nr:hypothetical protein [Planctomycetales bacterium]
MQKNTLIMAAVGVWVGAGIIFLVWFLGGDSQQNPESATSPQAETSTQPAAAPTPAAVPVAAPGADPLQATAIAAASLPATSSQTPPLDGGKLAIEVAEGWEVMPRNSSYVVGMRQPNLTLPQIIVKKATGYLNVDSLSAANAATIAAGVQKALLDDHKTLTQEVAAVRLDRVAGDPVYVLRYLRKAKLSGVTADVMTLVYSRDDLKYEIEMRAQGDTASQHANALYAVAASIEPVAGGGIGESFAVPAAEEAAPADE